MKRTLALTAVTAAAVLSLAGCGAERGGMSDTGGSAGGTTATDTMHSDDNQTGTGTSGGASTNRSVTDGLGSVTGAVNSGREPTRYGMTDIDDRSGYAIGGSNSSVYSAAYNRSTTQEQAAARSRLARMLANGRVHDQDGFLLDGENSSYHTF